MDVTRDWKNQIRIKNAVTKDWKEVTISWKDVTIGWKDVTRD